MVKIVIGSRGIYRISCHESLATTGIIHTLQMYIKCLLLLLYQCHSFFSNLPQMTALWLLVLKRKNLKFYNPLLLLLCDSACSLQSGSHAGHVSPQKVGTTELRLISLTHVLLFAIVQPCKSVSCLSI